MFLLFLGFLLGALAVIVAEGLAIFALLNRLSRKRSEPKATESEVGRDLDVGQSLDFMCDKKVSSRGEMGFEFHGFFFCICKRTVCENAFWVFVHGSWKLK